MSSPSQPPSGTGQKVSDFLSQLTNVGGVVSLAATIAGVTIPLIGGVIKKIKSAATDGGTVEYTVVLETTQAQLDAIVAAAGQDIADINAELAKLGLPPLTVIS